MAQYRKKPIVIEAIQWTGSNKSELEQFVGKDLTYTIGLKGSVFIDTLEGEMEAICDDWIIKGIKGEFYPCKPDIFEQTYELAGDNK